jgi:hypothetical protein
VLEEKGNVGELRCPVVDLFHLVTIGTRDMPKILDSLKVSRQYLNVPVVIPRLFAITRGC